MKRYKFPYQREHKNQKSIIHITKINTLMKSKKHCHKKSVVTVTFINQKSDHFQSVNSSRQLKWWPSIAVPQINVCSSSQQALYSLPHLSNCHQICAQKSNKMKFMSIALYSMKSILFVKSSPNLTGMFLTSMKRLWVMISLCMLYQTIFIYINISRHSWCCWNVD